MTSEELQKVLDDAQNLRKALRDSQRAMVRLSGSISLECLKAIPPAIIVEFESAEEAARLALEKAEAV